MMRNKTKDRFEDLVSKELNHYFVVSVLQCHLLLIVINFSFVVAYTYTNPLLFDFQVETNLQSF